MARNLQNPKLFTPALFTSSVQVSNVTNTAHPFYGPEEIHENMNHNKHKNSYEYLYNFSLLSEFLPGS